MLKELREILLNNSSFPDENKFSNKEMKGALLKFKKKFKPDYSMDVDIKTVHGFLRRHKFFEKYRWYLGAFQKMGSRLILIEGADAVGKTSLTVPLSKKLNAMPIDNQAPNLFYRMFKLPRLYKVAVADYNDNIAIGLLFYMCMNLFALEKAYEAFKSGYKYAVIDSSLLRTMSSRIAIPTAGRDSELQIDKGIYDLVKNKLNRYYLNAIRSNKQSLFFVFMYASDGVRRHQAEGDGREFLHYESNKKYAKFVEQYLRENQIALRRMGVPLVSMLLVTQKEKDAANLIKSKISVDEVFIRTDNMGADIEKKVGMVLEAMTADFMELHGDPKCCWL